MCKIGLCLAGGMGKGAYELGALKAIGELFLPSEIKCISAASIGVLNAYAFSTYGLGKAEELWKSIEKKTKHNSYIKKYLYTRCHR